MATARISQPTKAGLLPWQAAAWADKRRVLLLTGSAGGGKSFFAAHKLHALCLKYPGCTAIMLRKVRETCYNSIVLLLKRIAGPQVDFIPSRYTFEYPNGSLLHWGGMKGEEQREALRSFGQDGKVDFIWMEEATAFIEDDYQEMLVRLRGTAAPWVQLMLTTNPHSARHWIYQRLIGGGEASVHYSSAIDNPHNPAHYQETLSLLAGVLRDRLVLGLWKTAEGAVYDTFDDAVHVLDALPDPKAFPFVYCYASVDWGFTNPGVIQVWGVDRDGRLYLLHEVYMTHKLVSGVKGEDGWWIAKAKALRAQYNVQMFYCDPSEPAYIETFQKAGLPAWAANNELRGGIDRVQARLKVQADGKPRLFFYRDALEEVDPLLAESKKPTCTLDEITLYTWAKTPEGKPDKEKPSDMDNHGLDCVRYIVNARDSAGRIVARL